MQTLRKYSLILLVCVFAVPYFIYYEYVTEYDMTYSEFFTLYKGCAVPRKFHFHFLTLHKFDDESHQVLNNIFNQKFVGNNLLFRDKCLETKDFFFFKDASDTMTRFILPIAIQTKFRRYFNPNLSN